MNRTKAFKMDTDFEVGIDESTFDICVFGNESGFAYGTFASKKEAEEYAEEMRNRKTKK